MVPTRGVSVTQETVREGQAHVVPLLTTGLRAKRGGKAGTKWLCDETKVRVEGHWGDLYQALDAGGTLGGSLLSTMRDRDAATHVFR